MMLERTSRLIRNFHQCTLSKSEKLVTGAISSDWNEACVVVVSSDWIIVTLLRDVPVAWMPVISMAPDKNMNNIFNLLMDNSLYYKFYFTH